MPVWRIFSPSSPPRPLKPAPSVPHRPQKGLAQSFPSLFAIVTVTVTLSVALHGMTAGPAARRYGLLTQRFGECEENRPVSDEPFVGTPT